MVGGTVVGSQVLFMGCAPGRQDLSETFSPQNLELLNAFGETVIPSTETAGAATADVASFMKTIVHDFYTDEEQQEFARGILRLNKEAESRFGNSFLKLTDEERHQLLLELEKEVAGMEGNRHFYIMMKQLTIWGYLTSETAANQVFNHAPIPGRYDGCVEFSEGDKPLFPRAGGQQALSFARAHSK